MSTSSQEPWHLDRRVPIALIAALAMQTAGIVWWASQISSEVGYHTHRISRLEVVSSEYMSDIRSLDVRLARIEEASARQLDALQNIDKFIRDYMAVNRESQQE